MLKSTTQNKMYFYESNIVNPQISLEIIETNQKNDKELSTICSSRKCSAQEKASSKKISKAANQTDRNIKAKNLPRETGRS